MKNLDNIKYCIIGTDIVNRDMNRIYEYISYDLYNSKASKYLREYVKTKVRYLEFNPKIYAEIDMLDDVKRKYRRIPVKNYVLLYTIDEDLKMIYIAHMYYGRRNYMRKN